LRPGRHLTPERVINKRTLKSLSDRRPKRSAAELQADPAETNLPDKYMKYERMMRVAELDLI
jgi:hypothetical protein